MGEVYRARDIRLRREVAIKLLFEEVSADPERRARLEREARVLASLKHPNIATLYGFETEGDTNFLVMELVEGETLAHRIAGHPVPIEAAIPMFQQIAGALDAAHKTGVIHRDLKPSNIMIEPNGRVSVLDFGLAKIVGRDANAVNESADTPTLTKGMLVGTTGYMSPEQCLGRAPDKGVDIWAFGCCLYEALSGKRTFKGATRVETIARILNQEPDWSALPDSTPKRVRELIWLCLRKDPKQRLRDIGDARWEATNSTGPNEDEWSTGDVEPSPRRWFRDWRLAAVLVLSAVVAALLLSRQWRGGESAPTPSLARRTSIVVRDVRPVLEPAHSSAISPDARTLAFLVDEDGSTMIHLRPLSQVASRSMPGTQGALSLFFSPDSRWLGFFTRAGGSGKLRRLALEDGRVETLCEVRSFSGGSWGRDVVVFGAGEEGVPGLFGVAAAGGVPRRLTTATADGGEFAHEDPSFLPDGERVLFTVSRGGDVGSARLALLSLSTGKYETILESASDPHYVKSGHLVFLTADGLRVAPFDLSSGRIDGPPRPINEPIGVDPLAGLGRYSVSTTGVLAYPVSQRSLPAVSHLVWVDPKGETERLPMTPGQYLHPRLSPEEDRLVVTIHQGPDSGLFVYDFRRRDLDRVTSGGNEFNAVWSPDGQQLAFASGRGGTFGLFRVDASSPQDPEPLLLSPQFQFSPTSWAPAGLIVLNRYDSASDVDILVLDPMRPDQVSTFLATPETEGTGRVSPDGRWLAYVSLKTGRHEVYVQPFPGGGEEWRVSTEGGREPVWSPDGSMIAYRRDRYVIAVDVEVGVELELGPQRILHSNSAMSLYPPGWDLARDGRLLMVEEIPSTEGFGEIVLVEGWFDELRRLFD